MLLHDPLRRCDDDDDDSDEEACGSPAGSPQLRGDGIRVGIEEGDVYSHKGLKDLKISKLPENAASFRGRKSALITQFSSIDRTGDKIMCWLQEAFREASDEHLETLKSDSVGLPRRNAFIAAQVSDATRLKGEFGMEVQSYIERSQLGGFAHEEGQCCAFSHAGFALIRIELRGVLAIPTLNLQRAH